MHFLTLEENVDSRPSIHAHHSHGAGSAWQVAAQSTLHCLTGCVIGETAGLAIGVGLGLAPWPMATLATILSYATGLTLGLVPVMRGRGIGLIAAWRIIWIGEVVSIGAMEIAMNLVDYASGAMGARAILSWSFVRGLAFAVPAGFLAAWPINAWLLKRGLKACH